MQNIIKNISFLIFLTIVGSLSGCISTQNNESTGQYVDSTAITTKVKTQLVQALGLRTVAAIQVKTYKGVVQLSGFVENSNQIKQAIVAAKSIKGVRAVENSLLVKNKISTR